MVRRVSSNLHVASSSAAAAAAAQGCSQSYTRLKTIDLRALISNPFRTRRSKCAGRNNPMRRSVLAVACATLFICFNLKNAGATSVQNPCTPSTTIGFHTAVCSSDGNLALPLAFSSLEDSLQRAVSWYQSSPLDAHGFPPVVRCRALTSACCHAIAARFVNALQAHSTFVDGRFSSSGVTIDAAMQDGLGLLSYVKLYLRSNASQHLDFAAHFARYLTQVRVQQNITVF